MNVGEHLTCVREGSNISFLRNGVSMGIAYTDAPADEPLYPVIDCYNQSVVVTLIPDYDA